MGLVKVGGEKKTTHIFKTAVLGLKNTKIKNTKLSFEDDMIWSSNCILYNCMQLSSYEIIQKLTELRTGLR